MKIKEIKDWDELSIHLSSPDTKDIFLGNGFNLCLGVDTSYKSLFNSFMGHRNIQEIINAYDGLWEKIRSDKYNLECHQRTLTIKGHRSTALSRFYEIILKRCRTKYKEKETISFLSKFENFFTTNYDPLLYHFLLKAKIDTELDDQDSFYSDIAKIHSGRITGMIGFGDIRLKAITKKQVYDLSLRIFKN